MQLEAWYQQGKVLSVNQLEVFYRREGQGETLICLHGFPTSSWDFAALWPALAAKFDTVAHDLIGFGRSDKKHRAITIKLQADIVEQLAIDLNIHSAHIFAHDLGDTVAQELLARKAEGAARVNWLSCVFLNGGLFPETHIPRKVQTLLASPLGPLVARLISKRAFSKTFRDIFSPQHPPTQNFLDGSWQLLMEGNGRRLMPKLIAYMQERRENRQRWVTPLIESTIPLRLINGTLDPVSGLHAAERYKELVVNADIVLIDHAGHYPHVESPADVLEAFLAFHHRLKGGF